MLQNLRLASRSLEVLSLPGCCTLSHLELDIPNLREANLFGCRGVDLKDLLRQIAPCQRLVKLTVNGLTNEASSHSDFRFPELECLDCRGTPLYSFDIVSRKLREVSLFGCLRPLEQGSITGTSTTLIDNMSFSEWVDATWPESNRVSFCAV
mmetsp:Transcript_21893/g.53500  ORF Transcript_21893/g.53500 Transcript_21893/m.53500 type:complete len:152 (-) Transcript_21893:230-685(-)